MQDSDDRPKFGIGALQRVRTVIAAILLMVHWAAPSLRPFDPVPGLDDNEPAYSTALKSAFTGTLPRVLARIQSLEMGAAKPGRQFWPGSSSDDTLAPSGFDLDAAVATALPGFVIAGQRAPQRAHPFDARAPPVA